MAIRPIVRDPHPLLREVSTVVTDFAGSLFSSSKDMLDSMLAHRGMGLAAIQIGLPIRLVTIFLPGKQNKPLVLINPEIVHGAQKETHIESCLSCPGWEGNMVRDNRVTLRAQTLEGKTVTIKAQGLLARVFQHEIDHLNGVLFKDNVLRETLVKVDLDREKS